MMKIFRDQSLRAKILGAGIGMMILLVTVLFGLFAVRDRQKSLDAYVEKARVICLTAESVRQEMETKWSQGLFSAEMIRTYAEKGEREKILSSVPVISAWNAAMRKAEVGGYTFRVPKFSPRNPENTPDSGLDYAVEVPALQKLKSENLDEYYIIDKNINAVRYFLPVRLSPVCLNCHGNPENAAEIWGRDDGTDPTGGKMENWKSGEIHGAFEVIQSLAPADAYRRNGLMKAGIVAIIAILISILLMGLVASGITRPISAFIRVMEKVKDGDLTARLEIRSGDEIGEMSQWFNGLMDGLRDMLEEIRDGIETLRESVLSISDAMEKQTTVAAQQAASVSDITSAMAQLSATSLQIANHSGTVAKTAQTAWEHTGAGARGVEKVREKMNTISQDNRKKIQEIIELGKKSAEIGKVMEIISNITDQTKLIAFNAALEASGAGESGKRFSVVAAEIRRLADSVRDSAGEIEYKISEIQSAVNNMIADSEKGAGRIRESLDSATETDEKLREIVNGVRSLTEAAKQISLSTREQQTANEQIVNTLREIDQGAKENSDAIHRLSEISTELAVLSDRLKKMAGRFRL